MGVAYIITSGTTRSERVRFLVSNPILLSMILCTDITIICMESRRVTLQLNTSLISACEACLLCQLRGGPTSINVIPRAPRDYSTKLRADYSTKLRAEAYLGRKSNGSFCYACLFLLRLKIYIQCSRGLLVHKNMFRGHTSEFRKGQHVAS